MTLPPTKTILLIEEDRGLRSVFRDLLEKMDHWVIATPRSHDVRRIVEVAEMADLVVADVTVPDSESVTLTAELLARRRDLAAILISTDDCEFEVRQRFADHRTRFLTKPFSVDEMRHIVEEALALPADGPASERVKPAAKRRRLTRKLSFAWPMAAAAVLLLAVGAVMRGPEPPPLPETPASTVLRGGLVKVLEPTGDRREIPDRLSWEDVAGAASYRTRILAVDDTVLWEGSSTGASLRLAPEARRVLLPGVVYFWIVEALDAGDRIVARSQVARFQVVPARRDEKGE